jgi:glutathione S-transferase
MKKLLNELEIEYEYLDIDLLTGRDKEDARAELKKYNPSGSCPTVVIDEGEEVIIGFQDSRVREVLC